MHIFLEELVHIEVNGLALEGLLAVPPHAKGLVLFAHGSGSSRHSPRNGFVAQVLADHGIATLLLDLLTPDEDPSPAARFDIELLTKRLVEVTHWARRQTLLRHLPMGYFGASTGAAAALSAAAQLGPMVCAVVSRGGRPDLAGPKSLARVTCPTLLLVGELDTEVLTLNRLAAQQMKAEVQWLVVPGATHLFEEPGALESVAHHAAQWFETHLHSTGQRQGVKLGATGSGVR